MGKKTNESVHVMTSTMFDKIVDAIAKALFTANPKYPKPDVLLQLAKNGDIRGTYDIRAVRKLVGNTIDGYLKSQHVHDFSALVEWMRQEAEKEQSPEPTTMAEEQPPNEEPTTGSQTTAPAQTQQSVAQLLHSCIHKFLDGADNRVREIQASSSDDKLSISARVF